MPAQVHGRNSLLIVEDGGNASRNVSGDMNNIVLTWSRDNPVTTTMGNDTQQRISGMRDAVLTGAYIYNGQETTGVPQVMDTLLAASNITVVKFAPAGSVTGCPLYTACMLINNHQVSAPVGGAVTGTFGFEIASGSLTSGSCV